MFNSYFKDGEVSLDRLDFGRDEVVWILGTQTHSIIKGFRLELVTGSNGYIASVSSIEYLVKVRKDAVYPYTKDQIWVKPSLLRPWNKGMKTYEN